MSHKPTDEQAAGKKDRTAFSPFHFKAVPQAEVRVGTSMPSMWKHQIHNHRQRHVVGALHTMQRPSATQHMPVRKTHSHLVHGRECRGLLTWPVSHLPWHVAGRAGGSSLVLVFLLETEELRGPGLPCAGLLRAAWGTGVCLA